VVRLNIDEVVVLGGDRYVVTVVGKNAYQAVGVDNPKIRCTFTNAALGASHPVNVPKSRAVEGDLNYKRRAALVKMLDYWY